MFFLCGSLCFFLYFLSCCMFLLCFVFCLLFYFLFLYFCLLSTHTHTSTHKQPSTQSCKQTKTHTHFYSGSLWVNMCYSNRAQAHMITCHYLSYRHRLSKYQLIVLNVALLQVLYFLLEGATIVAGGWTQTNTDYTNVRDASPHEALS